MASARSSAAAAGRRSAGRRVRWDGAGAALVNVLVVAALVPAVWFLVLEGKGGDLAVDFEHAFLAAARAIADGQSPYPVPSDPSLDVGIAYVYPPLTALALVPVSWLPTGLLVAVAVAAFAAMVVGALLLVGVRDWRCHALVLAWPATLSGLQTSSLSIPIALALALAWRWRDRAGHSGAALGLSLAAKPIAWPLGAWLWATGRVRAVRLALGVGLGAVLVSWAAIGFAGLGSYSELVREITRLEAHESYTVAAVLTDLGVSSAVAAACGIALAAGLLGACIRRGRRDDDGAAFALAVAAALAAAPVVWLHYFVALAVPLGVAYRRLAWPWFLPLLAWGSPVTLADGAREGIIVLVMAAVVLVACVRPGEASRGAGDAERRPYRTAS